MARGPKAMKMAEDFRRWLDSKPSSWTLTQDDDGENDMAARRIFRYPGNRQAALTLECNFRMLTYEASFCLPFSAGPEATYVCRNVSDLDYWIQSKTKVLCVPMKLVDAPTYHEAAALLRPLEHHELYWLSMVFDVESGNRMNLERRIIAAGGSPTAQKQAKTGLDILAR